MIDFAPKLVLTLFAALTLSGCTTVGALVDAYGPQDTETSTPVPSASLAPSGVVSLKLGDCLDAVALEDEDVTTNPVVDCDSPHDLEIFFETEITGKDFPSNETLNSLGRETCLTAFAGFVGKAFADSTLDFRYYYPTESSWNRGDHSIDCAIFDPNGTVNGSLANANR